MTRDDHLELLNVASSILTMHVPHMGYRVPQDSEETLQYAGMSRDGKDSGAVDMLSPPLRAQFEDMLEDACHLLSMAFRRAVEEPIQDGPEQGQDAREEPEESGDEIDETEDNQLGDD